ncbi:Membrane protein OS=Rhodopirellula europaea SH398 GN=RESH_05017 PE=4 SV=1 [Gemmata massiliana]|uniref:Membrane protein n=1 Tax=Gemmata massiliana TaxID=1210884 RepID=A0A6P2CWR1_9BACT|nr:hypothetical protein [Gemmata massiliana]VTR91600.1 Membrane protein OS=Rhodopirellula europaea SH398 GN=RESH_05017 PE=4 SV=1 [Gemmata massiliana]
MSREEHPTRRSALLSFRFLFSAALGSALMGLVAAFGSPSAQLACLGCLISVVSGLFLAYLGQEEERESRRNAAVESLSVPLALAGDPAVFRVYRCLCDGLLAVAQLPGGILREAVVQKLESVTGQVAELGEGRMTFALTEGWRTVYERLLLSPGLKSYRSVAWVRTKDYWQDAPGRESMRANFEAVNRGVVIERIVILSDSLWPSEASAPSSNIRPWLKEQHGRGVRVSIVREVEIEREPDLFTDTGIYGTKAVGVQELDEASRTLKFTLDLDPQSVGEAEERWKRLRLYARAFE